MLTPTGIMRDDKGYFGKAREWWLHFEPHALPWITQAVDSGEVVSPIEAWHGAYILISEGFETFGGTHDWPGFDGHALLFEGLGYGGLMEGWSARFVILGMRSFMTYLIDNDAVRPAVGKHILAEIEAWQSRIIAYFENDGPWCRR